MLCQICHKNTATIHIKEFVNGQQKSLNICAECAAVNSHDNDLFAGFNIAELFMDIGNGNKIVGKKDNGNPEIIPLGEEHLKQINDFTNNLFSKKVENDDSVTNDSVKQHADEVDEIMAILDDIECENCHWKLSKFKVQRQLGCEKCYDSFRKVIDESLNDMHLCCEHLGKSPKSVKNLANNEKMTSYERNAILTHISKLQIKMGKYVKLEDYEAAAVIRDEIKKLKNKL